MSYRDEFIEAFRAVLSRQPWEHYAQALSFGFEVAAGRLFFDTPGREYQWFDGAVELRAHRKSERKVVFDGFLFVGLGHGQWQEPFRATVVDKQITKQGIWLTLELGKNLQDRAEGNIINLMGRRDA